MARKLAGAFAERVFRECGGDRDAKVDRAFLLALGRAPTAVESAAIAETYERLLELWRQDKDTNRSVTPEQSALENVCHALFNSAEFIHVD